MDGPRPSFEGHPYASVARHGTPVPSPPGAMQDLFRGQLLALESSHVDFSECTPQVMTPNQFPENSAIVRPRFLPTGLSTTLPQSNENRFQSPIATLRVQPDWDKLTSFDEGLVCDFCLIVISYLSLINKPGPSTCFQPGSNS